MERGHDNPPSLHWREESLTGGNVDGDLAFLPFLFSGVHSVELLREFPNHRADVIRSEFLSLERHHDIRDGRVELSLPGGKSVALDVWGFRGRPALDKLLCFEGGQFFGLDARGKVCLFVGRELGNVVEVTLRQ